MIDTGAIKTQSGITKQSVLRFHGMICWWLKRTLTVPTLTMQVEGVKAKDRHHQRKILLTVSEEERTQRTSTPSRGDWQTDDDQRKWEGAQCDLLSCRNGEVVCELCQQLHAPLHALNKGRAASAMWFTHDLENLQCSDQWQLSEWCKFTSG